MNPIQMTMDSTFLAQGWSFFLDIVASTKVELFLFFSAMAAYILLFQNRLPQRNKLGIGQKDDVGRSKHADASRSLGLRLGSGGTDQAERSFRSAFDAGDYVGALRCWTALRQQNGRTARAPALLPSAIEAMRKCKKDDASVLREIKACLEAQPMAVVNDVLEAVGRTLDAHLMEGIVEMLPSLGLQRDARTYEILLHMHFAARSCDEVKRLSAEMRQNKVPFTVKANITVMKASLRTNNFVEALAHFRDLKASWDAHGSWTNSPSQAPRHIVAQLVDLACKERQLPRFLPELEGVPVAEESVNNMLVECIRLRDPIVMQTVERLAREQQAPLTQATYGLLIKCWSGEPVRVRQYLDEIAAAAPPQGLECSVDFALTVLAYCNRTADLATADWLYERMQLKPLQVLSAFVRFYSDMEQYDKACDIYEQKLSPDASSEMRPLVVDARMERSLMNAALRCGRSALAKSLLDSTPSDVAKHITMIRSSAASGNLQGAMEVFKSLQQNGYELNSIVYNTVLDACVQCHDLQAAEKWMEKTKEAGMADVVSFNTLIKAHLNKGNIKKARELMEEMKRLGQRPNRVTFNEIINAVVADGSASRRHEIWDVLDEMRAAGEKPNEVTCSILLKSLNSQSTEEDIVKTMDLINAMEEEMDEVLLSSVVEACVRIRKPDLLSEKLKQLQGNITITGSHTFGSLIKAYGHARDIDGVWRCWKEMRSRHVKPTSITLGCMVEAVVSNGDTEGAFELVHEIQEDEQCRSALNSVIYCSVLKGFTREKKIDMVWTVYEEMRQLGVEMSIVTYNTLIDACARVGRMEHVPELMEGLQRQGIRPNIITYSTLLKGHCQAGNIQTGFQILEQMRQDTKLKPDEIMYNSLLDGCAQNNLVDEGLKLLEEMQKEGVPPSNYTLSVLVKLMSRVRKLDNAFALVQQISQEYKFKPNVHVYTNLIGACISNRQLPRALTVLEEMVKERIHPDNRAYRLLISASLTQNQPEQAAVLLRVAMGLPTLSATPATLTSSHATCPSLDAAVVNEALVSMADRGFAQELAVPVLTDIHRSGCKVRIDAWTRRRVMATGMEAVAETSTTSRRTATGKGRGRGERGQGAGYRRVAATS